MLALDLHRKMDNRELRKVCLFGNLDSELLIAETTLLLKPMYSVEVEAKARLEVIQYAH